MNVYELALTSTTIPEKTGWFQYLSSLYPVRWITDGFRFLYGNFVLKGLARLYIYGPSISGVGFWRGQSPERICSQLTESSEDFWRKNPEECYRIISGNFYSWVVLFEMIVYFWVLIKVTKRILLFRW